MMDGKIGKKFLKDYITRTRPILTDFVKGEEKKGKSMGFVPGELMKSYREMVALGKGVRGTLVTLGYKLAGGKDTKEITRVSTFIELFHSAILIHDDFMDRDPFRRGQITTHKKFEKVGKKIKVKIPADHYGNSVAVCLGDAGYFMSWKVLLSAKFPKSNVFKAADIYADSIISLTMGQSLDVTISGAEKLKEKDLLNVIWTKSGDYTALLPLRVGAVLAGAKDKKFFKAIEGYAKCFGWAFQIQDDVLGAYADEKKLGKPVGSDFREGKNTLLIYHLKKRATKKQLEFVNNTLGNPNISKKDILKMKKLIKESGSYDYVVKMGWDYVNEGKKYINKLTKNKKLRIILESLLIYMMERTK